MSLSIILPTVNRPTLRAAIESVVPQLNFADELIVIGHGDLSEARIICAEYPKVRYFEEFTKSRMGGDRRNLGMNHAYGSHFVYLDDDDVLKPDALEIIRKNIKLYPDHLLFFRMEIHPMPLAAGLFLYPKIWGDESIHEGNNICANVVVPNSVDAPKWVSMPTCNPNEETVYIEKCSKYFPYKFIDAVTHIYRPHEKPKLQ